MWPPLVLWLTYSIVVVQLQSHVRLFATPWTAGHQAFLSLTISWSLPKFLSIKLVMPSNRLILCCPLLLLPSIFPSIRVFSKESALHIKWPKYYIFSISPSNECSGLISFRTDWFDLAVQGTLKSFLQQHGLKALILQCSAFFMVQLSHLYMTTGKTIDLTIWIFVDKMIVSLLFLIHCLGLSFKPLQLPDSSIALPTWGPWLDGGSVLKVTCCRAALDSFALANQCLSQFPHLGTWWYCLAICSSQKHGHHPGFPHLSPCLSP